MNLTTVILFAVAFVLGSMFGPMLLGRFGIGGKKQ